MPIPPGTIPPYAEEIQESRIGLTTGMDGASNVTRQFRVYTAKAGDNPVYTMEHLSSALGGERTGSFYPTRPPGVPFTPGHFWGDGTYVLYNWTILDHWAGTNVWVLQANYVPSYVAGIERVAWTFRISSSLESEKSYTEIPWYDDAGNLIKGRGIGAPRYVSYRGGTLFTATSLVPTDTGNGQHASLQLADGGANPYDASLPRHHTGADIPTRAAVLTIQKKVLSWPHTAAIQAISYLGYVNEDDFVVFTTSLFNGGLITFAYAPTDPITGNPSPFLGQMLFSDLQIEPIIGEEGSVEPSFMVTMQFRFKQQGWQHKLTHTYEWKDDGAFSPIRDVNGNVIEETFHVVSPTSLSTVIGAF